MEELPNIKHMQLMCMCPSYVNLPARIDSQKTASLLGFKEHDITILTNRKLLKPLGKPRANATKYFSKSFIFNLQFDVDWLSKATKAISEKWRDKNSPKKSQVSELTSQI